MVKCGDMGRCGRRGKERESEGEGEKELTEKSEVRL